MNTLAQTAKSGHVALMAAVYTVFINLVASIGASAGEQNQSTSRVTQVKLCTQLTYQRTAALQANDWVQLDKISSKYIESCDTVLDDPYIANAYGDRSKANYELGNFDEAAIHANYCIDLYYFETSCHTQKFMSLASAGKLPEAKESFRIAEGVLSHAIKRNESELRQASNEVDRELHRSIAAVQERNLKRIQQYRSMLGNP